MATGLANNVIVNFKTMGATNMAAKMKSLEASTLKLSAAMFGAQVAAQAVTTALSKTYDWVVDSIKKFREFEVAIAEVSTILSGDAYSSTYALKKGIEELSMAYGKSATDLAKGTYDILSAAFDAKEAIGMLETATKAAVAGLSDVKTSVDIFTSVLNAYGMAASRASEVSDILFQSVIRGKFVYEDLESALGYVAPIASQAGISFDELMAAMSTATRHGLHLDMTARGLALAIQNIVNPTEGATKAADKYGINMDALSLRADGLTGFFTDLNEATKKYGTTIISELIPNMRSLRVAMVLAGDEGLEGFAEDLNLVTLASGKTNEALQKMMQTSQLRADILVQQMEYLDRKIGESWENADIWWKKAEVWWRTLFTGGDPNEAVREVENYFDKLEDRYFNSIKKMGKSDESLYNQILNAGKNRNKVYESIEDSVDLESVNKYNNSLERQANLSEQLLEAEKNLKTVKDLREEWMKPREGIRIIPYEELHKYDEDYGYWENIVSSLKTEIQDLNTVIHDNIDEFNNLEGALATFDEEIYNETVLLSDLNKSIEDLNYELKDEYKYGKNLQQVVKGRLNWELKVLQAEQDLEDITHDVNAALKIEGYNYNNLSQELQNAITTINNYTKEKEEQKKVENETADAIRRNNLEIMNLQLKGMMSRRGLNRSEKKAMKELQMSNLELRINEEESALERGRSDEYAYEQAQKYIDQTILAKEEETYQLKYNYDQQIDDLEKSIIKEGETLDKRITQWKEHYDTLTRIASAQLMLVEYVKEHGGVAGFDVEEALANVNAKIAEINAMSMYGSGESYSDWAWEKYKREHYQRGTYYVPHTGPAILHEGERVVPKGGGGGGVSNINVSPMSINVNVYDHTGVQQLVQKIQLAIQSGLISGISTGYG